MLNQVSSLNSLVGVNTPLATSGALFGEKPKTAMKKIRPPSQRPPTIRRIFLAWLMPCLVGLVPPVLSGLEAGAPPGAGTAMALIDRRGSFPAAGRSSHESQ